MKWLKFCLLPFLPLFLMGQEITLEFLREKPESIEKDFYIWRFLRQDIQPKDADEAFGMIYRSNGKLKKRYAKKTENKEFLETYRCEQTPAEELLSSDAPCAAQGLTTYKAAKLGSEKAGELLKKLKKSGYTDDLGWLRIFAAKDPFDALSGAGGEDIVKAINGCGEKYREEYFNRTFSKQTLEKAAQDKNFYQTTKLIVTNPAMKKAQESLLQIDGAHLPHRTAFFLAMNALKFDKKDQALAILKAIPGQDISPRIYIDRALFWQYLLTEDTSFLEKLMESIDINVYTLYASEKLEKAIPHEITSSIAKTTNKPSSLPINDPFFFMPFHSSTKHFSQEEADVLKKKFDHPDTEPHLALVYLRSGDSDKHFYITPYKQYINDLDADRQALIYAISRQESYLIPGAISTSYALGMMQIMPFNVRNIAKQRKENVDLDSMFDPQQSMAYANHLLNQLVPKFKNPLFIAYAYNGGWGFCTRTLKSGLFGKGKYEPWLSMEMVDYDESRYYGKRVLSNYVIYNKVLGKEIKLGDLLQTAVSPYL